MVDQDLPFGAGTARQLRLISADARISNRKHAYGLPPAWSTLYELTKLDDGTWALASEEGTRHVPSRQSATRKRSVRSRMAARERTALRGQIWGAFSAPHAGRETAAFFWCRICRVTPPRRELLESAGRAGPREQSADRTPRPWSRWSRVRSAPPRRGIARAQASLASRCGPGRGE